MKTAYAEIPFSAEFSNAEFYSYKSLRDLVNECELLKTNITRKCRTIGILQSVNGRFYLAEMHSHSGETNLLIQLSLIYLKTPVPSTVIPLAVQVFGFIQWRNRPVIYVKLMQVLKTSLALKMSEVMNNIHKTHTVEPTKKEDSYFYHTLSQIE